jgi:hypothetical protein
MKQTAVEWLEEQMDNLLMDGYVFNSVQANELYNQAKEIEKQQQDEFAIEFTEWCNDNYFRMGNTNIWLESKDFEIPIKYTTKELLEIFKKEKGL